MKILYLIFLFSIFHLQSGVAQESGHRINMGTHFPLEYNIGYNYQYHPSLSAYAEFGVLTKPYDGVILDILELFGTDEGWVRLIEDAFNFGMIASAGHNFHFNKHYAGVYFQAIGLSGSESPLGAYQNYFEKQDYSAFALVYGVDLTVNSTLYQAGIMYGYRFPLKKSNWEIATEIRFSKNIASTNEFTSNRPYLDSTMPVKLLYNELDNEIKETYLKYAYLPTLSLIFQYRF